MPSPYTSDTEITRNWKKNEPLSPEVRAAIYASVAAGEKKAAIACRFNIDPSTVYDTIKRFSERHDFKSRLTSGPLRTLDAREKRY